MTLSPTPPPHSMSTPPSPPGAGGELASSITVSLLVLFRLDVSLPDIVFSMVDVGEVSLRGATMLDVEASLLEKSSP